MRCVLLVVALTLAACQSGGAAPASPSCEIVVTRTADGRSGTAGCAGPSATPQVAGTQEPPKEQKEKEGDHRGKGR